MNTRVIIKQRPTEASTYFGLDKLDLAVHPAASHTRRVRVEMDGVTYVTGLNENSPRVLAIKDTTLREKKQNELKKERKRLEERTGLNLDAHNDDFWAGFEIELITPYKSEIILDKSNPLHLIKYYAMLENRFVAPSLEDLESGEYQECYLYVHDPEVNKSRRAVLQEYKDDVAAAISSFKNNKDKLFYICSALELSVNKYLSRDDLYLMLSEYRDRLKKAEDFEKMLYVLKMSNEQLMVKFIVRQAFNKRILRKSGMVFEFAGTELGISKEDVEDFLLLPENAGTLSLLKAQVEK